MYRYVYMRRSSLSRTMLATHRAAPQELRGANALKGMPVCIHIECRLKSSCDVYSIMPTFMDDSLA